jgi:outer membrane protein OmpA-like peptidoglycan-associated protein
VAGSTLLTDDAIRRLDGLADLLLGHPKILIYIEGHTDDSEAATRELALELSEARATAVRDLLLHKGVNVARLGVIAHGMMRPALVGDNERARERNRRIEIDIRRDRRR